MLLQLEASLVFYWYFSYSEVILSFELKGLVVSVTMQFSSQGKCSGDWFMTFFCALYPCRRSSTWLLSFQQKLSIFAAEQLQAFFLIITLALLPIVSIGTLCILGKWYRATVETQFSLK